METKYSNETRADTSLKSYGKYCATSLRRFLILFSQLKRYHTHFVEKIYIPLATYYKDRAARKIILLLRKILGQWSKLLTTDLIYQEFFTSESMQFFIKVQSFPGSGDFYLIIRLIPDMCIKAVYCLKLVQSFLKYDSSVGFMREQVYIKDVWQPKQRPSRTDVDNMKLDELKNTKQKLERERQDLRDKLFVINKDFDRVQNELAYWSRRAKKLSVHMERQQQESLCLQWKLSRLQTEVNEYQQEIVRKSTKINELDSNLTKGSQDSEISGMSKIKVHRHLKQALLSEIQALDNLKFRTGRKESEIDEMNEMDDSIKNQMLTIENELKLATENRDKRFKIKSNLEEERSSILPTLEKIGTEERVVGGCIRRLEKKISTDDELLPWSYLNDVGFKLTENLSNGLSFNFAKLSRVSPDTDESLK